MDVTVCKKGDIRVRVCEKGDMGVRADVKRAIWE
jgi:hypothetical protein